MTPGIVSCYCAPAFDNWWDRHVPDGCRDGRQSGNLLGLGAEIFVAVTAGAVAYLLGQHEGWELSTYIMVTIASNNGHEVISGMSGEYR